MKSKIHLMKHFVVCSSFMDEVFFMSSFFFRLGKVLGVNMIRKLRYRKDKIS